MTPTDDTLMPPAPRRSDDAFARSVAADVAAARAGRVPVFAWLGVPLAAAAALAFVVVDRGPATAPIEPGALASLVEAEVDAEDAAADVGAVVAAVDDSDDDTLLAFVGDVGATGSDQAPAFAFADLDGSTEQDLAAVEAALDRALASL